MNKDAKDIWNGFFIGSGSLIVVGLLIFVEALTMSLIVYYGLNHVLNPLLIDTYNIHNVHVTLPHAFVIGVLLNVFVKGVRSNQERDENIFKKAGKSLLHSAFALIVLYVSTLFI
ncbi:hypothetical protein P8907_20875 [Bacillus atrophaeus]|uniref:hypothetical protein n=1 Tax=Bacillus atrophaeus TaxID=1452 RepID=UPI00227FE341|nr:hypothetical protein [Bacillus atrophaeus]MCY8810585.1 hypothetical protein [Bacillus atrophaeus]MCY8907737.1 hypothetical protein [Bacillus atrophaeus]MEC0837742.1 hypothetical protein [Bacillus atrophaeus]MEC0847643.1 hypothetical protein [Bacillus atrophaeus]MEC0849863.1 hypothetical protein [Bacillus atrophaeus]